MYIHVCDDFLNFCNESGFIPALARPCARRIIANDQTRIVCVCNATYCDDVDAIGMLASNEAAIYATSMSGKRLDRSDAEWQFNKMDDKSGS